MYCFRSLPIPALLALLVLCWGCAPQTSENEYQARIRRTSYGVAHIEARDLANLGFGEGYAHAEDHACTVADLIVMVRGERAKYFGRGENNAHLLADIGIKALGTRERAAEDLARQPEEVQQWFAGYVAGYNRYLEETAKDDLPGWCRGADWVSPMTVEDLAAWHRVSIVQMPLPMVASARPPAGEPAEKKAAASLAAPPDAMLSDEMLRASLDQTGASNGWAIGKDFSENGRGMLLANPHYLWVGALRFWEKHLVIPGELNVYGAHILGIPGVAIGFNEAVGWTHTISAGERYTFYTLDLVEGKPTTYHYGDTEREMEARPVAVEVREQDGSLTTVQHTAYFSHYGPVVNYPGVGWTAQRTLAMRSANWDNEEGWRQWLEMNRARSMSEFQQAHSKEQGLGYVNTIATSADGVAWYADGSATPNLRPEAIEAWQQRRESDPLTQRFWRGGQVLLDGGDPVNEWVFHEAARDPGVVPFEDAPQLERTDYVFNANDNYWLANSSALIEDSYSPMHGEPETPRSPRTRQNDLHLSNRAPRRPAGDDAKFSLDEIAEAVLGNYGLTAQLINEDLVERCQKSPRARIDGTQTDLSKACKVLAAWDGRYELDSRGAVLFREFLGQYDPSDLRDAGKLFAVGFDPGDPINTPRQLTPAGPDGDLALQNLARAAKLLASQDLAVDVPLGELQYANRPGPRVPIHGGMGAYEGILNFEQSAANTTTLEPLDLPKRVEGSRFLTEKGYPVAHGASFLMVLEYTSDGPRAKAFLTYGQSGDPESEHFSDQMPLFSKKQWRPALFNEEDIAADVKREYTVKAPR